MRKKKAFTLAEVLIALTIIGVVSALTIPALIQRTNNQEIVTALRKAYSTLSQTANQIIAEEGSPKCSDGGWACSGEEVYNKFKKFLNLSKDCGTSTGCTGDSYKLLYGGNWNVAASQDYYKVLLSDGTSLIFPNGIKSDTCGAGQGNWEMGSNRWCKALFADVNGAKKPNQLNKDVFTFVIKENGLFPAGCDNSASWVCGPDAKPWGLGCTCRVLKENGINY